MAIEIAQKLMRGIFGSRNDRLIKMYGSRAAEVMSLGDQYRTMTDAELRGQTQSFRDRVKAGESAKQIRHEALAVAREVMDRAVGIRSVFNPEKEFDPQTLPAGVQPLYAETKAKMDALEPELVPGGEAAPGWMQVDIPNEIYAAVREMHPLSKPPFRAEPFECQIVGGMVLGEGAIAEMKTGEGKTIVGPLACYVACCENLQCHVVTVNDYLVQRDRDWVFPFYYWLGLTVGAIHPHHMQDPQQKQASYGCDVVYGTNSEFGFDYLRDNMKMSVQEQLQKRRDFCIIDEVDSILIDEARTPLIISGLARQDAPRYQLADQIARHLISVQEPWNKANHAVEEAQLRVKGLEGDIRNSRDKTATQAMKQEIKDLETKLPQLEEARDLHVQYYELEPERKAAHITHEGVGEAQKIANIGSFYVGDNMDMPHLLENSLRSHAIYKRDKDYVVEGDEVVIVDENTGRKMPGRQWSDGLHQAVETKEGVKVKEETQTMATVTIQNFAKLYKRLAGMTGTAITEATEFKEIYHREVIVIPTNVPVVRGDRNDRIYLHEKDKWNSIADEIKRVHDIGRPILVGTTSVAKSEALAELLRKRHGIKHEVLNAKQHEREGEIVKEAGKLGSVMISTNMAGRGTDIGLRPFTREEMLTHWQNRGLLPRDASVDMADDALIALVYRELAKRDLDLKDADIKDESDEAVKTRLFRGWCEQFTYTSDKKIAGMSLEQLTAELDVVEDFMLHRLKITTNTRAMGGLYVIGTERHESRRIDNQLRGRSGRQGDPGTSRFFLALEDELMKMFMPASMKSVLARMGMKEGEALEHSMVSNSVKKAQRKVEEMNYQRRKTLLEYDEVMEHQRQAFYGTRQRVLEGKRVDELIYGYVHEAVDDAVRVYLAKDYVPQQVAEWCQNVIGVSVDPAKVSLDDLESLTQTINNAALAEMADTVNVTLGEYMSNDMLPEDWDLGGLQNWAKTLGVPVDMKWLKQANVDEVADYLTEKAQEQVGEKDLSGLSKFFDQDYGAKELCEWANDRFGIELKPEDVTGFEELSDAVAKVEGLAQDSYREREVTYPAEYVMMAVGQAMQQDPNLAISQLISFVQSRYDEAWGPEDLNGKTSQGIYDMLQERSRLWLREGKLEETVKAKLQELGSDKQAIAGWLNERFGRGVVSDDLPGDDADVSLEDYCLEEGRQALRMELSMLERYVLLQILDQSWQDHLYAMDRLRDSIGMVGYAEKDPRIEFKRQGSDYFRQMLRGVRDRVTELIFKAQLGTPGAQQQQRPAAQQQAVHNAPRSAAAVTTSAGEGQTNREDGEASRPMSRKQRRARASRERRAGNASTDA